MGIFHHSLYQWPLSIHYYEFLLYNADCNSEAEVTHSSLDLEYTQHPDRDIIVPADALAPALGHQQTER